MQASLAPSEAQIRKHLQRVSVMPATVAGRPGVLIDDEQEFIAGRRERYRMRVALFMFCEPGGEVRVATTMCKPETDPVLRIEEILTGPDSGPPSDVAMNYFLGGGEPGRTLGGGSHEPEPLQALVRGQVLTRIHDAVRESGLPGHVRDAYRCYGGWPLRMVSRAMRELMRPGNSAGRDMAASNPLGHLVREASRADEAGPGPVPSPSLMRRFSGVGPSAFAGNNADVNLREFLRFAMAMPIDWIPDGDAGGSFAALVSASIVCQPAISQGLDPIVLTHSAGGDWPGFLGRMQDAVGGFGRGLAGTPLRTTDGIAAVVPWAIEDVSNPFAASVLLPLSLRAGATPDRKEPLLDVRPVAKDILFGSKSLPACLEASGRWHRHEHGLRAAMPSEHDERTWDALHPTVADGPFDIVPLTSSRDLMAEGSPEPDASGVPGMGHCIGGVNYRAAGASRRSHFVSVRDRHPGDGTPYRRVATAELRFERGALSVLQLQGPGNTEVAERTRPSTRPCDDRGAQVSSGQDIPGWREPQNAGYFGHAR